MGKTRDLFQKIRYTKGTFHAQMDLIKDRNSMDLTEAEDIKKRWQEYTEELYKKDLHDPDNHDDVITDLEPDILECEVKWALDSFTCHSIGFHEKNTTFMIDSLKIHNLGVMKREQWANTNRGTFHKIITKYTSKILNS